MSGSGEIHKSYFSLKKVEVLNVSSGETRCDFMGCCWEHEEGDTERQTDRVMESRKRECEGGREACHALQSTQHEFDLFGNC